MLQNTTDGDQARFLAVFLQNVIADLMPAGAPICLADYAAPGECGESRTTLGSLPIYGTTGLPKKKDIYIYR